MAASVAALLAAHDLIVVLEVWVKKGFRFTNMKTERFFALVKQAAGGGSRDVERYIAASFVAWLLQRHLAMGRSDPRIITRQRVVAAGVPIRAAKTQVRYNGPQHGYKGWSVFV